MDKKLKILHVITRVDTVGGAQRHVFDICNQLVKDGFDVSILSSGKGEFFELIKRSKIPFINVQFMRREISLLNDIRALFFIRRSISKYNPDVVAIHSVKAGLLARVACIGLCNKVFFTAHGWSHIRSCSDKKARVYKCLEYILSKVCQKVICVSDEDSKYAINEIGISPKKVTTIRNGTHKPIIRNTGVECSSKSPFNMLSVVRFQEPKDFITLIQSLKLISEYDWTLTIVGDGPELESVRLLIQSLGLTDKVLLEGFKEELSNYYLKADVVLLISKSEGLPMSLIEAMSYSKPIIASKVGGIPELTCNNNGFLIPENGVVELSEAIKQLINNKIKGDFNMGLKSYDLFLEKFEFSVMYNKLLKIYKEG